jgi:predicted RNase H-like HicB family nuclease
MVRYSIRVAWSEEDGMYVAVCPELGDLSALGDSQHSAVAELEQAIELALETYADEGWPIPEPMLVEQYSGQFRLRLPKALHSWLGHEAARQGVSLNGLVGTILAQAKGRTEMRDAIGSEVAGAINNLRPFLVAFMRSAIIEVVEDSSFSSEYMSPPGYNRYEDSYTSPLKLVESGA